jgi:hypothetical protein
MVRGAAFIPDRELSVIGMPADGAYQSIGDRHNETNVQRLCLPKWRPEAKVYGTAKGITSAERTRIYADRLGNRPDMTFGDAIRTS